MFQSSTRNVPVDWPQRTDVVRGGRCGGVRARVLERAAAHGVGSGGTDPQCGEARTSRASPNRLGRGGRYLVSIAPCALCHTPVEGSLFPKPSPALSGGVKISCGDDIIGCFGAVYAKNLTPDRETGLGGWTDRQIKRAIRSGITKDGRMMHWQTMPRDIFSNFAEADLEAIVAYLRSLPPVRKTIPLPTPSAPPGYLIYLGWDYGTTVRD